MTAHPKPARRERKAPRPLKRTPLARGTERIARKTRPRKERKTPMAKLRRILWEKLKLYCRQTHGNVCYTCGAGELSGSNWHTAHFVNAGNSSTVRYDPDNLRPCCYRCNVSLRGNIARFAVRLLDEIGEVKWRSLLARSKVIKPGGWKRYEVEGLLSALDKGGADYELHWAEKYGLTINEGVNA